MVPKCIRLSHYMLFLILLSSGNTLVIFLTTFKEVVLKKAFKEALQDLPFLSLPLYFNCSPVVFPFIHFPPFSALAPWAISSSPIVFNNQHILIPFKYASLFLKFLPFLATYLGISTNMNHKFFKSK